MKHYDDDLEKTLTAIFGVVGSVAIAVSLFLKGWTLENILEATVELTGLLVTVVVFLIAAKTMKRLNYSNFKSAFEEYLKEWASQNKYLIDEEKKTAGKENKEFYYMLTKAHHNNLITQERPARDFDEHEGSVYHKGAFLYTDYKDSEEIIVGLNKSFFIGKRGGELPKPFNDVSDIAEEFAKRIAENFEDKFEYIDKGDAEIPVVVKDGGRRLHISLKKIANTRDNAKVAIDMIEYVKTMIIALA